MKIYLISIFPEIFESFLSASLISKAIEKNVLSFKITNPRDFCLDKHQQVDDEIYGGGAGMLMKAQPIIDAVESVISMNKLSNFQIIFPSPSAEIFDQTTAMKYSEAKNIIFICGRYEGIDFRFQQYMNKKYPNQFKKISLGSFITLGGELPTMTMIEAITRLVPWVIKEEASRKEESYSPENNLQNIEYPQYTRPAEVEGFPVPEVLVSGHHKNIEQWKKDNTIYLDEKNSNE